MTEQAQAHPASNIDRLIEHYLEMNRYEKVLELVSGRLAEDPENGYMHYLMGVCLYQIEDYEEAEDQLILAMRHGFNPERVHELLGHVYKRMKRWIEAESAYLEALRLNPINARVHAAYAGLLKKTGHNGKAEKLMQEALRLNPNDPEVVRYRYLFGLAKDNRAEQIEALEKYMAVADDEVSKLIHIGLGELFRNRTGAARELFKQAFLLDPTNRHLAELLEELDTVQHVLLAPLRWIDRIGGGAVIWVVGIGSVFGTRALGWDRVSYALLIVYIAFVVYSWLANPLVKLIKRIGR